MSIVERTGQMGVVILCGGQSSRMGRNKADLPVCSNATGKSFLEQICHEMAGFRHKYISVNARQVYFVEGYTVVTDLYEEIGPLGGIYSVLKSSGQESAFFMACDMPLMTKEAVSFFIQKWNGASVAVSVVDGKRQPLAGIYTKMCLPVIERMIAGKNYRLGSLFDELSGQSIDMTAFKECYTNINTTYEYSEFLSGKSLLQGTMREAWIIYE